MTDVEAVILGAFMAGAPKDAPEWFEPMMSPGQRMLDWPNWYGSQMLHEHRRALAAIDKYDAERIPAEDYVLLASGAPLEAGDEYFQYGVSPFGWRRVEESAIGVRVPSLTDSGNFPAIYRRKRRKG